MARMLMTMMIMMNLIVEDESDDVDDDMQEVGVGNWISAAFLVLISTDVRPIVNLPLMWTHPIICPEFAQYLRHSIFVQNLQNICCILGSFIVISIVVNLSTCIFDHPIICPCPCLCPSFHSIPKLISRAFQR